MPTIFEAAENGKIAVLIRLKESGVNLNERDADGNTALLTAVRYGHLDAVKWLLSASGGAQITEENKAGNTALLLAVAYGHLEAAKWLLSVDGGATLIQKNLRANTPLLLAMHHGQLPVLDYLIRHHYFAANFNKKEKEILHTFSGNKSIRYYLDVFTAFSQEIVNYADLSSLLKKASRYLTRSEIPFIYLLCFWMQVRDKEKTLFSPIEAITDESCMKKLSPSLQSELMSHFFEQGYVLDNWSINKGKLIITGICLDVEQRALVISRLQQRENDLGWTSQDSVIKKNNVYTEYYLKPLYSSLIHALHTKDPQKVLNALSAPYTYHLNHTKDPISEDAIAKWTAYHLCQQPETMEKLHKEAYARLTDKRRLGYYNTLKKYLPDSIQKTTLLFGLGSLPTSDGERLYWVEEYPTWLQSMSRRFGAQQEISQTLELIGLEQPISLPDDISQQLWDKIKHKPQPLLLPGNHPVYHLKAQGIFCKLYPSLPGINDTLQYLYRRVFGASGGLPWSVAGLLKIDNKTIPVLLSEDVGSPIEANDLRLNQLDPYTLSKLILFTLLTNTEDGKRENHALKQNLRGLWDIFSVDNDQGLVEPITESDYIFFKTKKMAVKSYLFCLEAMKTNLDETTVTELLALKPMETLSAWLRDLIQLKAKYDVLFEECKDQAMQEENLFRRSYLQMILPVATVIRIAYKLQRLQEMLKVNPKLSPLQLLKELEPVVADYYEPLLLKPLSATERFDQLVEKESLYAWCPKTKTYSTSTTSGRDVFQSLVPDNQVDVVTPQIALKILEQVHQQWGNIHEKQVEVMRGEVARLTQLPLKDQQALLKLTRLNQFKAEKRTLLLKALAQRTDFTQIYLRYPETSLSDSLLATLLKNNTQLHYLSLTSASKLTSLTMLNKLQLLTTLKLTLLPEVKEFTASLPILTELILNNNLQLTALRLNAPQLRRLYITNCPNLEILDLPESLVLENVIIKECAKIPLTDFYARWPGFLSRWSDVPPGFRQRLVDCISQTFVEPILISLEEIYDPVTRYLNELRQLVWGLLPSSGSSNFGSYMASKALANAGYDHPLVISEIRSSLQHAGNMERSYPIIERFIKLHVKDELIIQKLLKIILIQGNRDVFESLTRITAARALGELHIKDELTTMVLLKNLEIKTINSGLIDEAIISSKILCALQIKDVRFTQALLKMVESDHPEVWACATEALRILQVKDERVIQLLLKRALDPDLNVYGYAIRALEELQVNDDRVIQELLKALEDSRNRWIAMRALGALQVKDDRVIQVLFQALDRHDWVGCSNAIKTLGALQMRDERVIQWFLKLLEIIRLKRSCWQSMDFYESHVYQQATFILYTLQVKDMRATQGLLDVIEAGYNLSSFRSYHPYEDVRSTGVALKYVVRDKKLRQILLEKLEKEPESDNKQLKQDIQILDIMEKRDGQVIQNQLSSLLDGSLSNNCLIWSILEEGYFQSPEEALKSKFAALLRTQGHQNAHQPLDPLIIKIVADPGIPNAIESAVPSSQPPKVSVAEEVKEDKSIINPLLLAAEHGDLDSVKRLLKNKGGIKITTKSEVGNTALSLAAARGFLPIVDYLLRHYYLAANFDKKEQEALALFTKNAVFHHYFDVYKLFSQKPINYKAIELLLDTASKQLRNDDLSFVYLVYFWMQIRHRTNLPSDLVEAMVDKEPFIQQHQLLPSHQIELISHMIREGYALDHWSITAEELVIEDLAFDEKQGKALETLLEQSVYDLRLMTPQAEIEKNTVYVEIINAGSLRYTVINPAGDMKVDQIAKEDLLLLGCTLTAPLTLDQLDPLPTILKIISDRGNIHPQLQTLALSNIRFTKEYRLLRLDPPTQTTLIIKNALYVRCGNDCIEYVVIAPSGKNEAGKIFTSELLKMGLRLNPGQDILNALRPYLSRILEITTQRNHTFPEAATKGYQTFLNLLKNHRIMPRLHSLTLNDCDLWDDWDIYHNDEDRNYLVPILAQRTTLRHLNLDNNHIVRVGLINVLKGLFEDPGSHSKLRSLSVRFNKIGITTPGELDILARRAGGLEAMNLEGNMIVEKSNVDTILCKQEHQKRVRALQTLLPLLSQQDKTLTIGAFLMTTYVSFTDDHQLRLKLPDERIIEVTLDAPAFECYKQLYIANVREYPDVFPYLKAGIPPANVPRELREKTLLQSPKKVCQQLSSYHKDARLKGHLTRHSVFSSKRIEEAPSFLFPNIRLTLKTGRVYLVEKKDHVSLVYEYLTGYGQRVVQIADLFKNKVSNKPYITLTTAKLEQHLYLLHRKTQIAKYSVETNRIKHMHIAIQEDVALGEDLPKPYQMVIFGSSQSWNAQNCLTYCLRQMKEHLEIHIPMDNLDAYPSTVVKKLVETQKAAELGLNNPSP